MVWRKQGIKLAFGFGLVALVIAGGYYIVAPQSAPPESHVQETTEADTKVNGPQSPESQTATFMAVGDILIHDDIYEDFEQTDGSYDFNPVFRLVKPIITDADFAALNQETILGGKSLGLSGLYKANSPQELGDAEIDVGFNIIQLANNHALDRGEAGIIKSLQFWKKYKDKVIASGSYLSQTDRDTIPIIEQRGIKLAYLSYTYGSNLGHPPKAYQLNFIDRQLIARDVKKPKDWLMLW